MKTKQKKAKENLVHIKLEYSEALESKKDLLSVELELVKVHKIIKEYKSIRVSELKIKKRLKGRVGSTLTDVKRIQGALPKIKLHHLRRESTTYSRERKETDTYDLVLENELEQIKEKLRALQT
jgi:hypothetical protein